LSSLSNARDVDRLLAVISKEVMAVERRMMMAMER
jgi:hypothetical protein